MLLDDFKDRQGNWVRDIYARHLKKTVRTYSGRLWQGIQSRCDPSGEAQKIAKSYVGTKCEFSSFSEFVEWARCQIGYAEDGYQLDKDILGKGRKVYSSETCAFVPREINLIVRNGQAGRDLPRGVARAFNRKNLFIAYCNNLHGEQIILGHYKSVEPAFAAHKAAKEEMVKALAEKWRGKISDPVYAALMSYTLDTDD